MNAKRTSGRGKPAASLLLGEQLCFALYSTLAAVIVSLTARGLELKRRSSAVPDGVFCATECTPEELLSIRDHVLLLRAKLSKNA